MATVTHVAIKNQIATYKWLSLLLIIVPNMLIPNTTQTKVITISIGHSNSAYSLPLVYPANKVTAAATIINCQTQK